MSTIIKYSFDTTRDFMSKVKSSYEQCLTETLLFEDWKCMAFPNLLNNPKSFRVVPYKYGTEIRVAPSAVEMLEIIKQHEKEAQEIELNAPPEKQDFLKSELYRKILQPKAVFTIPEPLTVPGVLEGKEIHVPIWFDTTMKGINVRLGFEKLDSAKPASIPLSDAPVHMMLGGITGAGKSVALNDIICSLLLEYAPWELELVLADFKIVELSRYANRIPTPHVSIVAATSSTEFALSTFDFIIKEMNARQEVFTKCGVQNIKDFREKFNLCLPRVLFIADEFVQMFENIKVAEQNGNDNASEQKRLILSDISAIARLGRSQGVHMLLSSQNMDGVLDDQTAGQFSAGATLAATPAVSNTLIGNPAGSLLQGKGKAFTNLNKNEKDPKGNVLVRVPYIVSDISEEDASKGKLSYLQELLKQMYDNAVALGVARQPYYYNENETLSRKLMYDALVECMNYMKDPHEITEVDNELFKKEAFARIPLGREVAYTQELACPLTLKFKQGNNLLIHADDFLTKIYICKLIAEGLSYYAKKYVIASTDESILRSIDFDKLIGDRVVANTDITGSLPKRYINMASTRRNLLDLQNLFTTKGDGSWDTEVALQYVYSLSADMRGKPDSQVFVGPVMEANPDFENMDIRSFVADHFAEQDESIHNLFIDVLDMYVSYYKSFKKLTHNFIDRLCASSFEPIVVWWLGAENFADVKDLQNKRNLKGYLAMSCQVGIFNVLVPSLRCEAISDLAESCNYILEKCDKRFFLDVNLPRNININKNSYQMHDRVTKVNKIVRLYS